MMVIMIIAPIITSTLRELSAIRALTYRISTTGHDMYVCSFVRICICQWRLKLATVP